MVMYVKKLLFPPMFTSACSLALTSKILFSFYRLCLYALLTKNFLTSSEKSYQNIIMDPLSHLVAAISL